MNCQLCGSDNLTVLTTALRNGGGTVLYCGNCDFGILKDQVQDPERYYAEEYRKTHRNAPDEETPEQIYNNTKDFQGRRLARLEIYGKERGALLEAGCSAGQFISQVKGHTVYGVEYDGRCREFVHDRFGILVYGAMPLYQCGFDYVCMFQVLEHISDPIKYLNDINGLLKPRGRVFIEVPNINDHLRIVPEYNKFYSHEAHNWYFSEKSLTKLCELTGFFQIALETLQDYGIRNYFHWLYKGRPIGRLGLMPEVMNELQEADNRYRTAVELNGTASNLFAVWEKK